MPLDPLSSLVLVAHWLIVLGVSLRVIMRRAPVGVAVAWIAVISVVPFVGAVLYLLMGERRLGRTRAARTAERIEPLRTWLAALAEPLDKAEEAELDGIRRQAERVVGFPIVPGNELALLDTADAVFDALVADIDGAQRTCHLCFYIWFTGGRVADVVDALERAARRGVECRVLADAVGSDVFLRGEAARRLRRAGVALHAALPTGAVRALFVRRDLRNHRKVAVLDDRVAYAGSQNVVDPRFFKQGKGVGEWVDAMARIEGPAAVALDGVFELDWSTETGAPLELPAVPGAVPANAAGSPVQVVPSGPDLAPEAIHQLLLTAIYAAREELVMTTPYFVPDDAILTALLSAALRGVAVTLIVPAHNDSLLVRHAGAAHFDDLATAGVHIALFEGGLLHTKSLTVDRRLAIFGSVNLDMRSLWLNFELSLFVYDGDFTSRLRSLQEGYLARSTYLDLEAWRQRPALQRFTENTFRLLGPLL